MTLLDNNRAQRLKTYSHIWWLTATSAAQTAFVNRWTNSLFLFGKALRLTMSLVFLFLLKSKSVSIAGYTSDQIILFYLTYQLIDLVAQTLYRGVYGFGNKIRNGEFDFYLVSPLNPLFRALTGHPDLNDALFLIPNLLISLWILTNLEVTITLGSALLYILLLLNGLLIATSFHILVLACGILTTEVDNIIWTYRDLSRLGQFPITMYMEPVRFALFFILPLGLMITIPAQVLMNLPPTVPIALTLISGATFFTVSVKVWRWALKRYTSASS